MQIAVYTIVSIVGTFLLITAGYLAIRVWSYGYYKSKKEFFEWYHREKPSLKRRLEDHE